MKEIDYEIDLKQLYKMVKKLKNEIAVLKVQIENLQDSCVIYDEIDDFRCQCG